MPKLTEDRDRSKNIAMHLSAILQRDDPLTFQKVLLDIACSHHELSSLVEQVGVRRETLWRYKTGAARAPFETLVKIMAVVGVKLVVVPS